MEIKSKAVKDLVKAPSSCRSAEFYDRLMEGAETRGILGKEARFNAMRISRTPSVQKYFAQVVKPYLDPGYRVLDFGCGPGSFMAPIAAFCKEIIGVDISQNFVSECEQMIHGLKIPNAGVIHIAPDHLPFEDGSFDALVLVDVIHHLENVERSLKEAIRVIRPGGRVLIFEPNKLNPLIALIHLFDRNEWGLLRLGTPGKYQTLLNPFMRIDGVSFNGIVIGPQSKLLYMASDILNHPWVKPVAGWLNPKMFITGTKL